jgi:hypothetical protein
MTGLEKPARIQKPFNGSMFRSQSHNATVKYATTRKAAWNVTFLGFMI